MKAMRPRAKVRVQAAFTVLWIALVLPTITVWHNSILWVGFISIWANVISHWTAYEAAEVEMRQEELELEERARGRA